MTEHVGADLTFLVSATGGNPFLANIRDMAGIIEADAYYDEVDSRMRGARIFKIVPGETPEEVYPIYEIVQTTDAYVHKIMRIHAEGGDVIASAPYELPIS